MNLHQNLNLLILLTVLLLTTQIPGHFCQFDICRQQSQCGNITIDYPFTGVERPPSCGQPGFDLTCNDAVPVLNISSTPYRILELDYTSQTLRIAREDLTNNLCRPFPLRNTTLDLNRFRYSSTNGSVTLYYGCTVVSSSINGVNCNGTGNLGFYTVGEESAPAVCNTSVVVPVGGAGLPVNSSYGALRDAIASGFSISWLDVNNSSANCRNCVQSGGVCGYNNRNSSSSSSSSSFVCYCADQAQGLTCSNAPRSRGSSGPSNMQRYLILGASLGVTFITIIAIIVSCYFTDRSTSDSDEGGDQILENIMVNHGSLAPKRYTYSDIEKITKSFTDKLGQGGFGSVYKGTLPDGRVVAVKVLTTETNSSGEDFLNEVASISRTSHVNIVNLLGFCYNKNRKALIYEYMPNKSLDKFIYKSGSRSKSDNIHLGLDKLYEIAVGVARGLEYLHRGCNTRIVHFDIKPQNILLDEDFCPKISDFGLAQLCKQKQSILSVFGTRGTIGYIAPEVFCRNFGPVSHKSDVYSFGMMVLEMAGARKNSELMTDESGDSYFPDKVYEQRVLSDTVKLLDEMMTEEEEVKRKLFLVGFWCIQTVPSERPSMNKVVEMLEGSVQSIPIPPKPFLASPMYSELPFSSPFLRTGDLTEDVSLGNVVNN